MSNQAPQILRITVFVGFFLFAGICIFLTYSVSKSRSETIKKIFVIALVVGMIVPTISGGMFPPFVSWAFFTGPAQETTTQYSVAVVDGAGNEFDYPVAAAPPGRVDNRGKQIATSKGAKQRDQMAKFLLNRAEDHRRDVANGLSIGEYIKYRGISGRLMGRDVWTVSEAQQMEDLREIRVYKMTIFTSPDGTHITDQHQELVYSYHRGQT